MEGGATLACIENRKSRMSKSPLYRSSRPRVGAPIVIGERPVYIHSKTRFEEGLGERIPVRCFTSDPSVASSLKFLRKTPWAREKVEGLYLFMLRDIRRTAPRPAKPEAG